MKNAIKFANEIVEAVQITGAITIEESLEEFMKDIDNPQLFIDELQANDIAITTRAATHLAIFPSQFEWVIIKATELISDLREQAIQLLVNYSKKYDFVFELPELEKLTKSLVHVLYTYFQNDMRPVTFDFIDLLRNNPTANPIDLYKTFDTNNTHKHPLS